MKLDQRPGRFASEKENFYLSCNTDNAVLVGLMEKDKWTCPVLGLVQHMIPLSILANLTAGEDFEQTRLGNWSGYGALLLTAETWNRIWGIENKDEVGLDESVILIETDHGSHHEDDDPLICIIRLHMGFE